jgi:hypothetical protein
MPVVVGTSKSSQARLKPASVSAVTLTDGFWVPRLHTIHEVTPPTQYQLLEAARKTSHFVFPLAPAQ